MDTLSDSLLTRIIDYLPASDLLTLFRTTPRLRHLATPSLQSRLKSTEPTNNLSILDHTIETNNLAAIHTLLTTPTLQEAIPPSSYARAIRIAIAKGRLNILKFLIGIDEKVPGRNPLSRLLTTDEITQGFHAAAIQGHIAIVDFLISLGNLDLPAMEKSLILHDVVEFNERNMAVFLLDSGFPVSALDENASTPLHRAGRFANLQMVQLLLTYGADVSIADKQGWTPLIQAIALGRDDLDLDARRKPEADSLGIVTLLLESGAGGTISAGDENGLTALHYAAHFGLTEIAELLIQHGADLSVRDIQGLTPVFRAAVAGKGGVFDLLYTRSSPETEAQAPPDGKRVLSLTLAIENRQAEIVRFLVDAGADLSLATRMDSMRKRTPLELAVARGFEEIVLILLDAGADVSDLDDVERTPLQLAASEGYEDIVCTYLDRGVEINIRGEDEGTALHYACTGGHVEIVSMLIDAGADLSMRDAAGCTPLHCAANWGEEGIVRILIDAGADHSLGDNHGSTALHYAVGEGHVDTVNILIKAGADISARDNYGRAPLHDAAGVDNTTIIRRLLDEGADVAATDEDGQTAVHVAASSGYPDVLETLIAAGANVFAVDGRGCTASHCAASGGLEGVVQLHQEDGGRFCAHLQGHLLVGEILFAKGVDWDQENLTGDTVMNVAWRIGFQGFLKAVVAFQRRKLGMEE